MAQAKIEESIAKEIKAGRMFGPFPPEQVWDWYRFFRTNPLGAVVNGDGSMRAINNLSYPHDDRNIPSVNSFVAKEDFQTTWDDFKAVSRFLRNRTKPALMAIFDWEKAYRQIPTAPSQWPFLMLKDFNDQIIINTRIAFGGVAGCGSFVKQKYIGFIWIAKEKTVRLPEEKLLERIRQIKSFLVIGEEFSFNQAEVLAGRMNHVSYMLPQLRCYLCSLYRWMCSWVHRKKTLPLPI
ncbi:hypothetical protein PTTG_08125, partial [Puccinia triticina 1-1 BBBD Race 1]